MITIATNQTTTHSKAPERQANASQYAEVKAYYAEQPAVSIENVTL